MAVLEYELTEDGVAILTLNRPDVLNALSLELVRAYGDKLVEIRDDDRVRVLVTRGAGESFCTGTDLAELDGLPAQEAMELEQEHAHTFGMLRGLNIPTVAAMKGYVLGGGLTLACSHDVRIATHSTLVGMPEVLLGWVPAWGMHQLTEMLGYSLANALTITGETFRAHSFPAGGLYHMMCVDGELDHVTETLASKMATIPEGVMHRALQISYPARGARSADERSLAVFRACFDDNARDNIRKFLKRVNG